MSELVINDAQLKPIAEKVLAGERLSFDDGIALYRSSDLLAAGWLANSVREKRHGNVCYYNVNRHINPTNVCVAHCRLCAFGRDPNAPGAYTYALEEIYERAEQGVREGATEFHLVGGLHPDLPFEYFLDLMRGLKQRCPRVHLKAFTMVEVGYFARIAKLSIRDTLVALKESGVDSLPGGGAEIFNPRVRKIICDHKVSGQQWLNIARTAHEVGLPSNATMLYGHIETEEERVEHLVLLRDNFDHIKAYWIMLTPSIAQIALRFGADDLDGTVVEEKIYHDAGATTAQFTPRAELERLIRAAGRVPVERDTLYHPIDRSKMPPPPGPRPDVTLTLNV